MQRGRGFSEAAVDRAVPFVPSVYGEFELLGCSRWSFGVSEAFGVTHGGEEGQG